MLSAPALASSSRSGLIETARASSLQRILVVPGHSTSPSPARFSQASQTRRCYSTQTDSQLHPATSKWLNEANQDTAFAQDKKEQLGLRGLLPPTAQPLSLQIQRCLHQLRSKQTPLGKHIYLAALRQTNTRLFYAILMANGEECLPLVYTPVVGEACQKFSKIYRRPEGLTLTIEDKGNVAQVIDNWPVPAGAPRIAVLTDGSRILGLGDLGWNGMGISIGKLSLYVAAAGIHPRATIPICVDLGTNNEENLEDPLYLGLRRKRASSEEYREFLDEVMEALHLKFPNLIVQYEDFSTDHAFEFLERYQNQYPMFNDDIQGTGSVVLGGFVAAARVSSKASGRPLSDQKILFLGAGSAGVGVAKQLMSFFKVQGLSEDEARKRIYLVDSKGLVTNDRGDKLPAHKTFFSRDDNNGQQYKNLIDVVEYVKPTALIGLSTVSGAFDGPVLEKMAELNKRPIVFPLSNPVHLSECTHEDAIKYTKGTAVFASGSPFDDVEYEGKRYIAGQGNNLYVFPGIGLAAALGKVSRVTEEMITAASFSLANALNDEERAEGRIYPSLKRVREVSRDVAKGVLLKANEQGVARDNGYTKSFTEEDLGEWIEQEMWVPSYGKMEA
ncbi:hypothetical protein BCV69DRAFT_250390 [Microstroma glucosiphilum]|uniref:Malic enzyme n=1 Tax=Pseudomicrostroma glucosiphilum TaxID=1684307 RepID=A0A316U5W9_9BASI|nr:hypothetical protein BCV69DRAFT_250390 [Pseudomicrostroma glucosiphilum]PWN19733.1 hypothetical protein BCV69DRAFT_250390 [Pseudomicrostroma glucosiphilum]